MKTSKKFPAYWLFLAMGWASLAAVERTTSAKAATAKKPGRFSVNLLYLAGFTDENKSLSHVAEVYAEKAVYTLDYSFRKGNGAYLGLGYRLGKSISVELGGGYSTRESGASVNATIPHPLWPNIPRSASSTISGLSLKEAALCLNALYCFHFGRFSLGVYAGPCAFLVQADLVSTLDYKERNYPYTEVDVLTANAKYKENVFGWNAGLRLHVRIVRALELVLDARYLGGKAEFATSGGDLKFTVDLGGARAGAGLRFVF